MMASQSVLIDEIPPKYTIISNMNYTKTSKRPAGHDGSTLKHRYLRSFPDISGLFAVNLVGAALYADVLVLSKVMAAGPISGLAFRNNHSKSQL